MVSLLHQFDMGRAREEGVHKGRSRALISGIADVVNIADSRECTNIRLVWMRR